MNNTRRSARNWRLGQLRANPEKLWCRVNQDEGATACFAPKLGRSGYQSTRMDSPDVTQQRQSRCGGLRHDTANVAGKSKQEERRDSQTRDLGDLRLE